ncbi:MAG: inovirus-type Gp2 protein [Proteobacteria bacterium]|nr:inovirus-type Gp2 protein [Pseudomonadota bacterium]
MYFDLPEALSWINKASSLIKAMHAASLISTPRFVLGEAAVHGFGERLKALIEGVAEERWRLLLKESTDPYILPFQAACDHYFTHLAQGREPSGLELMSVVLQALQSPLFALRRDSVRRLRHKVRNSLQQYVHDLKLIYSKLMIVRLDLWYMKGYTRNMLPEQRILEDWERLLRFIAQGFTPAWVGYAVKFEYGPQRGVHAHVMLLFNGREVREDETIGRIIGEHWRQVITDGVGGYFNTNTRAYKAQMEYCGIGTFTSMTDDFQEGVARIADYLAKPDHGVRLAVPGLDRSVRRSYLDGWQRDRLERLQAEACSD